MLKEKFYPDAAANKMITAFPRAKTGETIKNVEKMILKQSKAFDTIDYVYIIDENEALQGVISIKELHAVEKKDSTVEELMTKTLVVAHPSTDQEKLVYLALSHNIKAIPIVDDENRLLGIVPYDTILQIFNEEVRQDTFRFGGIFHKVGKEYATIKSPASVMIKTRLPWLIIGVLGGSITASIITSFENVLGKLLALAAFAPVLAYLSDAVGTQSETLAVRSLALESKLALKSYFSRELIVAFTIATVCGLLLSAIALIGWQDYSLGIIVGLSMFLSIFAAVFISTSLPFLFKKLNLDPAIASGPFATMVSDVATISIYFGVATLILLT